MEENNEFGSKRGLFLLLLIVKFLRKYLDPLNKRNKVV